MTRNRWLQMVAENPGHSAWYIERFRAMAADGADLDGEARFVDTLVPRRARILDAGCGTGYGLLPTVAATVVAFAVGLAVIAFLMRYISTRSFLPFVLYRILLGGVLIALLLTGVLQP